MGVCEFPKPMNEFIVVMVSLCKESKSESGKAVDPSDHVMEEEARAMLSIVPIRM